MQLLDLYNDKHFTSNSGKSSSLSARAELCSHAISVLSRPLAFAQGELTLETILYILHLTHEVQEKFPVVVIRFIMMLYVRHAQTQLELKVLLWANFPDPKLLADLLLWRLAANILNKQTRTNDKGRSFSLGVGRGVNDPHRKRILLRKLLKSLGPERIFWINDPSYGIWVWDLEHGMLEVWIGRAPWRQFRGN
jgi:hypothetical protein